MPDPREAVYDVLKAKAERAAEEQRRQDKRTEDYRMWAQYRAENERASSAYRGRTRG